MRTLDTSQRAQEMGAVIFAFRTNASRAPYKSLQNILFSRVSLCLSPLSDST